jgi:tetratricopeptide (TPR) repeat protein
MADMAARPELGKAVSQAVSLQNEGRFAEAERLSETVLSKHPYEPTALLVRGVCLLQRGEFARAEASLRSSLAVRPAYPAALANLGVALHAQRRSEESVAMLRAALEQAPRLPAAMNALGLALTDLKRTEEALQWFDRAVGIAPGFAEAWCNRGNALILLDRFDEALASLDRAEQLRPNYPEVLVNRSAALSRLRLFDEALAAADRANVLLSSQPRVERCRADALAGLGRRTEAIEIYSRLLDTGPYDPELGLACATGLLNAFQHDQALTAFKRLAQERPDDPKMATGKAMALRGLGRYDEAIAEYQRAAALDPDDFTSHLNEGMLHLLLGDFEAGWPLYEWRKRNPKHPLASRHLRRPLWTGAEDITDKTILLYAEQGFGDAIQFARFAPLVAARGARVIVGAHPPLKRLFQSLDGVAAVIGDGEPVPAYDLHCPLMSLPLAFDVRLDTIPGNVPYLVAPPELTAKWDQRLGPRDRLRVGLAWAGSTVDDRRKVPLALFEPIFRQEHQLVCLGKVVPKEDLPMMSECGILHFGDELTDFAETAALAATMDLVISIDTSVAHLAGALGATLWVLLHASADWRWLLDREDSPWYPTARLFRQHDDGDWGSVMDRVADSLTALDRPTGGCQAARSAARKSLRQVATAPS